ncbi:GNAT family N-acetyltransferase [Nocardioides sp. DS6]|uniref:GNAT family N-acetyltransferase n=1 Tax=Nocardioides eburneus TaxID=3231482 RepID=A0ABV3SYE1_9ACTN
MPDARHVITERLDLSAMSLDDTEELFPIFCDERTWWYDPPGRHIDIEQTRRYATVAAERWSAGLSYWTVRLRATGAVIGSGGVQRHEACSWNLNYRLAPDAQGHGYATELVRAALDAARAADPNSAVIAWIDAHNVPSRRVAERAGLIDHGVRPTPNDGRLRVAYADRALERENDPTRREAQA